MRGSDDDGEALHDDAEVPVAQGASREAARPSGRRAGSRSAAEARAPRARKAPKHTGARHTPVCVDDDDEAAEDADDDGDVGVRRSRATARFMRGLSFTRKYNIRGDSRDVVLDKRHRVLILARILLAAPAPAFLVFSAVQHMQAVDEDISTAWGLSAASFTQLQAGQNFTIFVAFIAAPLWVLSLLVAQIEEKRPGSLPEWLAAYDEQRLESFPSEWLKAFCETKKLSVSGEREKVLGRAKEWLKKHKDENAPKKKSTQGTMINQGAPWDFFMSHTQKESGRDVALITMDLRMAGKKVWLDVNMNDCGEPAMMEGVEHSETFVLVLSDGYFDSTYCVKELRRAIDLRKNIVLCHKQGVNVGAILKTKPSDPVFANIGDKQSLELIVNDNKYRKVAVERLVAEVLNASLKAAIASGSASELESALKNASANESVDASVLREAELTLDKLEISRRGSAASAPEKDSTPEQQPPNDTPTPTTEPTEAKPKPTPSKCLVSLWNYFVSLLKWDTRIWSVPKAVEAALFFGSVMGYGALYTTTTFNVLLGVYMAGTPIALLIVYMVTKTLRSIIDYQYNQKVAYHTFVNLQAYRLSILTIFGVCVATYGESAMSRVVIPSKLQDYFEELSLDGISCTDRDAFWTAFEASAVNASCAALPNCGYTSFEDLCQAVQYTPMLRAVGVDVSKVLLYNFVGWVFISLLVFGTGRASPTNGYVKLLSRHMIVAMVLGLAQLISAVYSFLRLLLLVPLLRLPRPAAYFDRTDLMARELPLYFYGPYFIFYDFWGTIFVHVLIAIALNFDFLKKYASRLRRVDEEQEQKAIDEMKQKMTQMKKNEETGEMECEWSDEAPYFYFLPREVVLKCKTRSLPPMQTLRDVGRLEKKRIPLSDAFNQAAGNAAQGIDIGDGIDVFKIKDILFVSHRWEEPGRPDVNGVQLEAIKEYLKEHLKIKWVWFDYSSMPQKVGSIDTRTPKEKAEFQLMLCAIADLYLTAQVLILLDGSYASRFWPLTEAWCSMQTATAKGFVPSTEENRRYTIKHIHTADDKHDADGLIAVVSKKKVAEMVSHLEKPGVNVTNAKDKKTMLHIIRETETHVKKRFQKLQSPQSPPSGSKPASRSQPKSGRQAKKNQVAPSDSNAATAN